MTVVQSNSGTFDAPGGAFTVSLPSATSASNRVVVLILSNTVITAPGGAGFTLRTSQVNLTGHYLWDAAGGSNSWSFTPSNTAKQGIWYVMELYQSTYDTSASSNNAASATTYASPTITPATGDKHLIASFGSVEGTNNVMRTATAFTNSFTEIFDTGVSVDDYPMHAIATRDVVGNGTTTYTTTVTFSVTGQGRSAIIASYSNVAGGSALTASPADSVGITDSVTASITGSSLTASPADTAGITDSAGTAVARAVTVGDSIGITDTGAPQQLDIGMTLAESIGLTDSAGSTSARALNVADNVGLLDATTVTADRTSGVSDTVGITDTSQADKGQSAAASDSVGVTDAASTVNDRTSSPVDTVGLSDGVGVDAARALAASESIGLTDSVQADKGQLSNVADTVGLTDATATIADRFVVPADVVGLTDSVSVVAIRLVTVTDTAGITDSVQADLTVGGNTLTATVADGIGLVDSTATVAFRTVTVTDTLDVVDAPTTAAVRVLTVSDTISVADIASGDLTVGGNALTATISDSIGLLDATTHTADRAAAVVDLLGVTDSVTLTKAWTVTISDTVTTADSVTAPGPYKDYHVTAGRAVLGANIQTGRGAW